MKQSELNDLENEIIRLKQKISDYLKISEMFGDDDDKVKIQTNIMLEDLSKLLKRKEKLTKKD